VDPLDPPPPHAVIAAAIRASNNLLPTFLLALIMFKLHPFFDTPKERDRRFTPGAAHRIRRGLWLTGANCVNFPEMNFL
jgi:hypothetical protein